MRTDRSRVVRPRLLYLGHTLPYPPDWGATLRGYHTLRALEGRYEVDALCFHDRTDPTRMPLDARVRHIEELANVELVPVPEGRSPLRRRLDRLRDLLAGTEPVERRYENRAYRGRLMAKVFERDPRIIHMDSLVLRGYLPLLKGRTVVLVHDRPAGEGSYQRLGDLEEWLPHAAATLVPFDAHRETLSERVPNARIEVVPPAVDLQHFTPGTGTGHGLAYVGGTERSGSRDALEYFAEEILPRLRSASGVQALEPISWVGPAREGDREAYRGRGIDVTGYVEDIRPIVRPAACYFVPRRVEGGQTRILQAWAMGKAVVSTAAGCAGLAAVDGQNLLVRDDPAAFARAVLEILEDRQLRRRLGEAGRHTVEERYGWEQRGRELMELYRTLEGT